MTENEPVNIGRIVSTEDATASAPGAVSVCEPMTLAPCPADAAFVGAVVMCKRCQHRSPAGTDRCERCKSMLKGNRLAVSHGLRALHLPVELEHLRDEVAAFEAGCIVDEADAHDIPTRRRALLSYRARLHRRITQLDDAIELRGLIDRRGRLRATWLQQLQGLIATAKGLDTLLGLERRQRRVDPLEAVRQAVSEATRRAETAREVTEP